MANKNTKYRNAIVRKYVNADQGFTQSQAQVIENNRSYQPVLHGYPPHETGNTAFRLFGL